MSEHDEVQEASCVFCKIARVAIADEGVEWTSFPPLGPHAPGHMLFIPRRHVRDATVEPALTGTVFAAASAYLGRVLRSEGNLLTSVGVGATQTVPHLHVHVIPRGTGDGLPRDWPWLRPGGDLVTAEAAKRRLAAVEALAEEWERYYGPFTSYTTAARKLRAALATGSDQKGESDD